MFFLLVALEARSRPEHHATGLAREDLLCVVMAVQVRGAVINDIERRRAVVLTTSPLTRPLHALC